MIDSILTKINSLVERFKNIDAEKIHVFFRFIKLKFLKSIKRLSYFSVLTMAHDGMMAFFSLFLTLYLKIGDEFLNYSSEFLMKNIMVFVLVSLGVFNIFGTQKAIWKFISVEDLSKLNIAVLVAHVVYFPLMLLLSGDESFSIFVPLINMLVFGFLLNTSRLAVRLFHDHVVLKKRQQRRIISIPVLIIGDEDHAELFIRDLRYSDDLPYDPVGILTLKESLEEGQSIHDVSILGCLNDFESIIKSLSPPPRQLIVADPNVTEKMLKSIAKIAKRHMLPTLRLPTQVSLDLVEVEKNKDQETSQNSKIV